MYTYTKHVKNKNYYFFPYIKPFVVNLKDKYVIIIIFFVNL
jgi:hypothetical protein